MKLYFSPGACALHPQIALREAGLSFDLVRVDLRAHKTHNGADFSAINPKGYVPVLELADGTYLTEGAVIDQYIADLKPEANLIPRPGTIERYRAQEWLNFIASEIHKAFSPLFSSVADDVKELARTRIGRRFELANRTLTEHPYLLGATFSVADGYLFNMLRWTEFGRIDLAPWPALAAFYTRVGERPAVITAIAAERA